MIKKLRVKVILLSAVSVAVVLFLILGTVNILNYRGVVRDADGMLRTLADNDGKFPERQPGGDREPENREKERTDGQPGNGQSDNEKPEDRQWAGVGQMQISKETPFETRYFSVRFAEDGTVSSTDLDKIAAVDETEAKKYAEKAVDSGKEKGFLASYRYYCKELSEGRMVIFVDCSKSLSTVQNFLEISVLIALLGLLAVTLLVAGLSGRIVRPFAESYEKQKRFITDAGHEIRTPLTISDADLAVLEMEQEKNEPNEWMEDIQKQTNRLRELTEDLIYLSKMEEEEKKEERMEFPISDVISEVVQSFQGPAKLKGKKLKEEIQPMLAFNGDMKGIRKLTGILVDNAVKYADEGGEIVVELKAQGKTLHLTVSNPAQSVKKEQVEHLFDRFYRGDESRSTKTGGYGLGLSIAKAVVTAHQGKIHAVLTEDQILKIVVVLGRNATKKRK